MDMDESTTRSGQAVTAGDAAMSWPAALAAHEGWLRRLVRVRLQEPQAVDDVMQEVALAVAAKNGELIASVRAASWLYGVAVRQALLYRRKSGRRRKLMTRYAEAQLSPVESQPPDPLAWLLLEERHDLVRAALQRIPSRDMDVLVLKYSEGWSYRQIADHIGATVSAVETRLHRARKKLREQLHLLNISKESP